MEFEEALRIIEEQGGVKADELRKAFDELDDALLELEEADFALWIAETRA